jgi:hypothetical protein
MNCPVKKYSLGGDRIAAQSRLAFERLFPATAHRDRERLRIREKQGRLPQKLIFLFYLVPSTAIS